MDENGVVTAVAAGEAGITAETADRSIVSNAVAIRVTAPASPVWIAEITVSAPEGIAAVPVGGRLRLSADVFPADADHPAVIWSVADGTGHGIVDADGVLTGESAGTVTVTAAAADGSGVSCSLEIEIQQPANASLESEPSSEPVSSSQPEPSPEPAPSSQPEPSSEPAPSSETEPSPAPAVPVASIQITDASGAADELFTLIGDALQLVAVIAPEDAADRRVTWSIDAPDSADPGAGTAEIDGQGLLTGLTQGNVAVRATSQSDGTISAALAVTVIDPQAVSTLDAGAPITGVTVTAAEDAAAVATEHRLQLSAAVAPADADQTVSWSVQSGDASIDDTGLLTAGVTEGSVTLRAASTVNPAVFGELTLQVVTSYPYVLVLNTNPDPTVIRNTGTLHFAGSGASTQPSRTAQTYSAVRDVQGGSSVSGYRVGDSKTLGYSEYVCIGVGEHCYVWMESGLKDEYSAAGMLDTAAAEMMAVYQGRPYQALTALAEGELPTRDGTGKLSILMERITTSSGYFAGEDGITAIHIKVTPAADYTFGNLDAYAGLLAHEGQHALFQHFVCGDDAGAEQPLRWLNEGLSVAVMDWVWGGDGNGSRGWLSTIGGNDRIRGGESLAYANYRDDSGLDYGLPYLFVRYLTDQAANRYDPLPHLAKFYKTSLGGGSAKDYLDAVIGSLSLSGNASFAEALQNFYIAAVVQSGSGVHGFCGDPVVSNRVSYPVFDGASDVAYELPGTGALVLNTDNGVFLPPEDAGADLVFIPFQEDQNASAWGGGIGTPDSPYEVNANSILGAIALNPAGYYTLTEDIDLTGSTVFTIDSFSGTLNGNGHTIRGVGAPLIYENRGTVCNLTVELAMDGQYGGYVGGVVCLNQGNVRNVNVTGTFAGRLTGTNPYGCPVAGALVGKNYGEIHACKAAVDMRPGLPANHVYLGQIAGWNCYRIYDCIAAGSIAVSQSAPGSYDLYAGGLTGWLYSDNFVASLKTSYSLTSLDVRATGAGNNCQAGRLVGREKKNLSENTVAGCYGLTGFPAAGQTEAQSSQLVLSDSACLRTDAQLRSPATFGGWNTGVWNLEDGSYPRFGRTADPAALTVTGAKSSYYVGEALDLTGAAVVKVSGDVASVTAAMLYEIPALDTAGAFTVRGVYDGIPFAFPVTVAVPEVTALSVRTPARDEYYAGRVFEADAVQLTATIDGREVTIVSGFTVDKTGPLAVTDTQVTYTYFGQTATQAITVRPRAIQSIVRTAPAAKTSYYEGEPLSLAGLTFRLTYSDGAVLNGVTADQLSRYGLKLLRSHAGALKEIPSTKTLSALEDDGAILYVYLGGTVPAALSGVYCAALTLDVGNRAHLADQTVVMHTGFRPSTDPNDFEYVYSDPIEGGSYDYTTTRISGSLPAGISVTTPGIGFDAFLFSGLAQSAFDVSLVYQITDNVQSNTFFVTIRLVAEPLSDACDVLEATLGGIPCTVGEDTITVVLPQGRSLSGLAINASLSPGAKTNQNQWNGTRFDCSNGNTPTLTVYPQSNPDNDPSGMCKVYTLRGSVATAGALAAPQNLARAISVVTWEPVDGADIYLVTLMRSVGDTESTELLASCTVAEPRFDMWPAIRRSGRYYVTVRALDGTGVYSTSPEVTTAADLYYCNMTPVSRITISGPASVIEGGTGHYAGSVSPYDAGNAAIAWSVENGTGEASITAAGVLTGVRPGDVTVKALAQDGSGVTAAYAVTVLPSSASRTVTVDVSGITKPERALWIDGVAYTDGNGLSVSGDAYTVELTSTTAASAVVYSMNSLTETDPHKVYPSGMTVWLLAYEDDAYTVTRAAALDNLLRYSGSFIRITGNKGIRMITSIATETKAALTGGGINGYTLLEYGTVVAWTNQLGVDSLVLGGSYANPAYAYKKNVADPVYKEGGGLTQYTNVLVNFDIAKCSPDLSMRPYIVLEDAGGKRITLYGGTIQRSIGYIAYQNRNAFAPGTASYQYIWEIIHGVYGNTYDGEYRG